MDSNVLDSKNTRTYGREIFAGGKEGARGQPWKGCRGRGTQPAACAAEAAGREATSREKIRPDAASDHFREAEIRHGIYGVEHLARRGLVLPRFALLGRLRLLRFLSELLGHPVRVQAAADGDAEDEDLDRSVPGHADLPDVEAFGELRHCRTVDCLLPVQVGLEDPAVELIAHGLAESSHRDFL